MRFLYLFHLKTIYRTADILFNGIEMKIKVDDLKSQIIADFLEEHIEEMKSISPPESKHALNLDALRQDNVTFWSVWQDGKLLG